MSTRSRQLSSQARAAEQTMSTQNANSVPVRRRILKACNYCRQRKIKCNGNTPCLNCKNHGIQCEYSKTMRKKKVKQQPAKKLTLESLEKRLQQMDQKYDILNENLSQILRILKEKNINVNSEKPSLGASSVTKKRGRKPKVEPREDLTVKKEPENEVQQQVDEFSEEDNNEESSSSDEYEEDAESEEGSLNNEYDEQDEGIDSYEDMYDEASQLDVAPTLQNNAVSPVGSSVSSMASNEWKAVMTPTDDFSFASPLTDDQSNLINKTMFDNTNNTYSLQSQQSSSPLVQPIQPVQKQQLQYIPNGVDIRSQLNRGFDGNPLNSLSMDISNMESRFNLLYGELPTISAQLENDSIYN